MRFNIKLLDERYQIFEMKAINASSMLLKFSPMFHLEVDIFKIDMELDSREFMKTENILYPILSNAFYQKE